MTTSSNVRIAKNTILLYVKMLISLVISLYTSRAILSILGEDDFGIYNVVGGVVVLFSFLTNSMTASTQRFLNYNIELNDGKNIAKVFNTSMMAHITILGVVLVLAETIGLWFMMTQLNIPQDRYIASIWVYQTSVVATLLNIIVIPYRSSIIATERMGIFAYLAIVEVILKLVIVLILPLIPIDSLILYSIFFSGVSFLNFILYRAICRKKMWFTHFHFVWDKALYAEQMSFSGWYLFGGLAVVGAKQGINILINIFYNVAVNAAVGISNQVRTALYGFVTSFQTAFNPQIVKLYASGEYDKMLKLIYRSSKFSYYLLFILSLPVIIFCEDILSIWLVNVPKYAVVFTQLVIITSFTEALSAPLWTAIGATGKIQRYQILVSLIIIIDIPLVYFSFKLGYNPTWAFIINFLISFIAYVYRLLYVRKYISYRLLSYLKFVLFPSLLVTFLSCLIPLFLRSYCVSIFSTVVVAFITVIQTLLIVFLIGINHSERCFIINMIKMKLNR